MAPQHSLHRILHGIRWPPTDLKGLVWLTKFIETQGLAVFVAGKRILCVWGGKSVVHIQENMLSFLTVSSAVDGIDPPLLSTWCLSAWHYLWNCTGHWHKLFYSEFRRCKRCTFWRYLRNVEQKLLIHITLHKLLCTTQQPIIIGCALIRILNCNLCLIHSVIPGLEHSLPRTLHCLIETF